MGEGAPEQSLCGALRPTGRGESPSTGEKHLHSLAPALHSGPVSGITYKNVDIQYMSQVGWAFFRSVTTLIFSRYIFNSFPFIAPPRQKRNASNHFLSQQNSCGNLKYCGMSGQVTAQSLSFSLKWNSYPLVYGTNSTTGTVIRMHEQK